MLKLIQIKSALLFSIHLHGHKSIWDTLNLTIYCHLKSVMGRWWSLMIVVSTAVAS